MPAAATAYLDTGLTPGASYSYQVLASNTVGNSVPSGTATATTPAPPLAVSQLQPGSIATASAALSWELNSSDDTDVQISRRVGGAGSFSLVTTLPAGSTNYVDNGLQPGTLYEYHVSAVNLAGAIPAADTGLTTLPLAPVATAATDAGQVQVSWTACNGAVAYNVYRGLTPGGEGAAPYATVNNAVHFTDVGVAIGQTYYYRVTAVDFSGESVPSTEVAAVLGVVMTAAAANWTDGGLTLTLENDGLLHVVHTDTGADAVSPQIPADVALVAVTGRDNATDALTIDFSHGNPIPSGGVAFDGGQGGSADSLSILDAGASDSAVLGATQLIVNGSSVINYQHVPDLSFALGAGTLDLGGNTQTVPAFTLVSGQLVNGTLSSNAFVLESGTVTASLTGPGGLTKTGTGTVTLSHTNTYTGATTIGAGILAAAASDALGTGTVAMTGGTLSLQSPASPTQTYPNNIVVTAGSTIDVKNEPAVMGPLFIGSNTLAVTGATGMGLTVGTTFFLAGNPTFAPASGITLTLGGFNDAGTARTVTVSGQGIVTAAGPAVGVVAPITLDVTGGTFIVNNATSLGTHANVVLSNGATLGLGANQTFATLGGTGTVNLNGHLLTAGGYDMKLAGASPGQYDELNVTGKPTLTGASLNLSYVNNFLPSLGESFTIIQTTGGVNGQFTQGNTITAGMVTYSINYAGNGGNAVVLTVASMAATHFVVNAAPSPVAPGGSVTVTVTAEDANNHQTAAYSGPFTLSSSDRLFTPLTHLSLTNGSGTFTETLETLGSQTFTVTDNEATNPLPAATSNPVTVALVATHFLVQASPATVTAGTPLLYSVTAVSAGGQTVTGYSGTVTLTTSDVGAPFISQGTLLPTSATISGGVGYFLAVLDRVGSGTQTITATDSVNNLTGTGTFTVTPAATSQFVVSGAPAGTLTGSPFSLYGHGRGCLWQPDAGVPRHGKLLQQRRAGG